MTDPGHPIHRGGTLSGRVLRDAIIKQTEIVGGPGILVNYINGKAVISLRRQVVPKLPGVAGDISDVFAGKIVDIFPDINNFNATYTVQNLAETLTTPKPDGQECPSGNAIDPPRCDGIINVTPYNRAYALPGGPGGGLNFLPAVTSNDLHSYVVIEKIKDEVPPSGEICNPPVPPGEGKCEGAFGCFDDTQAECDIAGGTFTAGTCCNPLPGDPAEPADYRVWFIEGIDTIECGLAGIAPPPPIWEGKFSRVSRGIGPFPNA